ncbi:MAG: hypoxanthine-guanine phosphoribosyltransferase [Cellvibrionaceae bacterium]
MSSQILTEQKSLIETAEQLYDLNTIDTALDTIANKINKHFTGFDQSVIVLSILKGGLVVTGHLLPKLAFDIELDYVHATRYRNQTSGVGEVEWKQHPSSDLKGRAVLIIDDIFDEGITLAVVKQYCIEQGAKNVSVAVLLDKQHDRKHSDFVPDYIALTVPDVYVFGFGLDYHGHYRNAPGIYSL